MTCDFQRAISAVEFVCDAFGESNATFVTTGFVLPLIVLAEGWTRRWAVRKTALLLMLCSSASAVGQAAIKAATAPRIPAPAIRVPQMPGPGVSTAQLAARVAARPAATLHSPNSRFHANVLTLIGLTGLRRELLNNRQTFVMKGKEDLLTRFPSSNPAFAEEWARRVEQSMSVDDFVKVVVAAYEKNFTNQDVLEMIQVQQDVRASRTPVISPRLQAKLSTASITVHSEIMGGFAELGYKLGAQVGQQVAKEHPEWLKGSEPFTPSRQTHPFGSVSEANASDAAASVTPANAETSPNFVVVPAN